MGEEDKKSPEEDSPQIDSAAAAAAEGEAKETVTASASAETPAPSLPESEPTTADNKSPEDKKSTAEDTAVTASENEDQEEPPKTPTAAVPAATPAGDGTKPVAIVASNKKERPPYKYDPNKITLRFLFANKDGLTVTVECKPSDTVGEVKGALLSVWPNDLPDCDGGELLRLVCMGKGFLMPDTRTLEELQIPVFKTHPTPVNVSVKVSTKSTSGGESPTKKGEAGAEGTALSDVTADQASQGCACTIL